MGLGTSIIFKYGYGDKYYRTLPIVIPSSHIYWFVTYENKSGGNVLMGNDAPCKFVGIGFVQIRMHDGVVRTLIEVCHIPELKKNLVSVGAMDLKGFSC